MGQTAFLQTEPNQTHSELKPRTETELK